MKRALLLVLAAISLTGCAVRAGYYYRPDPYYHYRYQDHDRYRDDRWR